MKAGRRSREEDILEIFFNYPTKQWHFEALLKEAKIARSKMDKWLKRLIAEGIVKKVKEKGKMPYYIGDYENPSYYNRKKIFTLEKFYKAGFLNHLRTLPKAKIVIIFGSMTRGDWYNDSDIDVFVYGNAEGIELVKYEMKFHKEIQMFECEDKKDLEKMGKGLIQNVIRGNLIKGDVIALEKFLYA